MLDMNMRPSEKNPGRGYRFYTGQNVLYPFGHGLSYYQILGAKTKTGNVCIEDSVS